MRKNDISYENICINCNTQVIDDYDKGETVCPKCGMVTTDHITDTGPDWKALDSEDKIKKVRVGAPRTLALHDYGLTTNIGPQKASEKGLNKASVDRMRIWQNRIRTSSLEERGLVNVLNKITIFSSELNLPKPVSETASHIYRTAAKMRVAKSKSIAGMAAASVYLACRKHGTGRTLNEVAKASGLEKSAVGKYYRLIINEVEKDYVPHQPVQNYISKLVNKGNFEQKIGIVAQKLAKEINDSKLHSGKSPQGLAGAFVYISSVMNGYHIPQREISEYAEVTEVTIRNRCREILQHYSIKQKLKTIN